MSASSETGRNLHTVEDLVEWEDYFLPDPKATFGYEITTRLVGSAIRNGFFDPTNVRRVLDFGSGSGSPIVALKEVLPEDVSIDASEPKTDRVSEMVRNGIVPLERVYVNGFARLRQIGRGVPDEKYDLVTAFMFGPYDVINFGTLIRACRGALTDSGQLMVYSDPNTFGEILGFCSDNGIEFSYNPWGILGPYGRQNTLHVSASSINSV